MGDIVYTLWQACQVYTQEADADSTPQQQSRQSKRRHTHSPYESVHERIKRKPYSSSNPHNNYISLTKTTFVEAATVLYPTYASFTVVLAKKPRHGRWVAKLCARETPGRGYEYMYASKEPVYEMLMKSEECGGREEAIGNLFEKIGEKAWEIKGR